MTGVSADSVWLGAQLICTRGCLLHIRASIGSCVFRYVCVCHDRADPRDREFGYIFALIIVIIDFNRE